MDILKDKVVINQDNKVFIAQHIIKESRLVAYFFSASWCSNALYFLPKLRKVYDEGKKRKCGLEIIFISLDTDNLTMMKHFQSQGYWFALVFGDDTIGELRYRYNVTYVPALIVVNPDGNIITKNGVYEVEKLGIDVLVTWSY